MADPLRYDPSYDFSDFQESNSDSPLPGVQVDTQLADISTAIADHRNAIMDVRRADGALANGSVGPDQLADSLVIGFTLRGAWDEDVDYSTGDGVSYGSALYKCREAHTSSSGHEPGVDTDLWEFLITLSTLSIDDESVTPDKLTSGDEAAFQAKIGTGAQLGALIDALTGKTTPVDADELGIADSAASYASKKLTFANLATWIGTKLGGLVAAATSKSTPVDADSLLLSDSAAGNATKKVTLTNFAVWASGKLGSWISGATAKTTPVSTDSLVISDSEASGVSKKLTFAYLKVWIGYAIGDMIAAQSAKSTPVNADSIAISDSADSDATKKVTLTNLWANFLKAKADALYLTGPANSLGRLKNNGSGTLTYESAEDDLGTISTTSGTGTKTLNVTLTGYRRLRIIINAHSQNGGTFTLSQNSQVILTATGAGDVFSGLIEIDLASGLAFFIGNKTAGSLAVTCGWQSGLSTASTSISFVLSDTGDGGSIKVYAI